LGLLLPNVRRRRGRCWCFLTDLSEAFAAKKTPECKYEHVLVVVLDTFDAFKHVLLML